MAKLTIIRGVPGTGKSTLAKSLIKVTGAIRLEADNYFVDDEGNYNFDPSKLKYAHAHCQKQAAISLSYGSDVIVSNTFTTKKEIRPYFDMAKEFGIVPQVITLHKEYGSVHDVPETTMVKMRERFQYDISELFQELKETV